MSSAPIFFAPLKVPVTDPQTGLMSRDWYLFFQAIFLRVGGVQAFTPDDNQITGEMDDATEDGSNIVTTALADLERAMTLADEQPLSVDLAELQALSASFSEDPIIARFTAQWDGLTPASGGGTVKFLRADGAWAVPAYPTVPVGANPTASVGPTVVNGAALTFMRSDAAPPIDLTAAYTWTGSHIFSPSGGAGTEGIQVKNSAGDARVGLYSTATEYGLIQVNTNVFNLIALGASTVLNLLTNAGTAVQISAAGDTKIIGKCGFNNTAPIAKPTVTGSRGANAALASVLTALASYGLITDSST